MESDNGKFTAGWNNAGYMPESDPSSHESFEDAKSSLLASLLVEADWCGDMGNENDAECFTAAAEDLNLVTDMSKTEWSTSHDDWEFWITESV